MGRDHLLWSAQIDPLTVMAAMYTKDNEWPGIVCLEPDFFNPPHGGDSDDPGHQEATVMATYMDQPWKAPWTGLCHFHSCIWCKANSCF